MSTKSIILYNVTPWSPSEVCFRFVPFFFSNLRTYTQRVYVAPKRGWTFAGLDDVTFYETVLITVTAAKGKFIPALNQLNIMQWRRMGD
jgi:hypothetical protein